MLDPFATASRYIAIHQVSLLSHAACASMSTTTSTTTTTTRDRGDRYGAIEWAQQNTTWKRNEHTQVPYRATLGRRHAGRPYHRHRARDKFLST